MTDPSGHSWFKKFVQKISGFLGFVGTLLNNLVSGDWSHLGQQIAVAAISVVTGFIMPGFGTISSNLFLNMGVHAMIGAAGGALVGGISSVIMGGSFGQGAITGAIGGAVGGGFKGFTTSEQFLNWKAGNGFQSDAQFTQQQHQIVSMYDQLAEEGHAGFEWGTSGSFFLASNSGHSAWGTNQMPLTGKWPVNGASKLSWFLGRKEMGDLRLESSPGFINQQAPSFAIEAPTIGKWGINRLQMSMLQSYYDKGPGVFVLNTGNCANWSTGAARTIGIPVPSSTRTYGYTNPSEVKNWLQRGYK